MVGGVSARSAELGEECEPRHAELSGGRYEGVDEVDGTARRWSSFPYPVLSVSSPPWVFPWWGSRRSGCWGGFTRTRSPRPLSSSRTFLLLWVSIGGGGGGGGVFGWKAADGREST